MSDKTKKKSERSIVGLKAEEITREEWDLLVKLEQFLMKKGMRELKKQQETGQPSEELEHIVEALKDYDSVRIKGARVSSTMELVKYLTEYKSIIQEKTIRDIWDMDFT